jgi:hypothetical protein
MCPALGCFRRIGIGSFRGENSGGGDGCEDCDRLFHGETPFVFLVFFFLYVYNIPSRIYIVKCIIFVNLIKKFDE